MGITKDNPLHMLLEFQQMESGESIYHKEELMEEIFPPIMKERDLVLTKLTWNC